MKKVVVAMPGNETLAGSIAQNFSATMVQCEVRRFPDEESYVRLPAEVRDAKVFIACTLHQPDPLLVQLYFLSRLLREKGAAGITLVAPYLPYLRQDKLFKDGEALTSTFFAELLSGWVDGLITVDPHLHRIERLSDIYKIPVTVLHATGQLAGWLRNNVAKPFIIGPDSESRQWVQALADESGAPCVILSKTRRGDRQVEIRIDELERFSGMTPVLVDDIISTGHTMAEAVRLLLGQKLPAPVCLAVHAVFSPGAYEELLSAGAAQIVSCNTIVHFTNRVDINGLFSG